MKHTRKRLVDRVNTLIEAQNIIAKQPSITLEELAERINVNETPLRRLLDDNGCDVPRHIENTIQKLCVEYPLASAAQIAAKANTNHAAVKAACIRLGIPYPQGEAMEYNDAVAGYSTCIAQQTSRYTAYLAQVGADFSN